MTEAEFLPLFDQYRPMVYGLALSYTRSPQDAEDVCQEVFLTLLEKPPAPGKERPWLARVAVNRCRDLLTSPWRRRRENDDTALERLTFETPEEAGLFAALGALSPTAGPCSTCAITRGSRWPSWPASSAPPPRRSPPGSTGPNNNSGRSWRNSAMKKLYQRTFEQVLAQTCPLNRVEEQRRALASRCSPYRIGGNCHDHQTQTPHPHPRRRRCCGRRPHCEALAASGALGSIPLLSGGAFTSTDSVNWNEPDAGATVAPSQEHVCFPVREEPDLLTVRGGSVYFTTETGEELDITGQFSEAEPYVYSYTASDGSAHDIVIGGSLEDYGYMEYVYDAGGSFVGSAGILPTGYDSANSPRGSPPMRKPAASLSDAAAPAACVPPEAASACRTKSFRQAAKLFETSEKFQTVILIQREREP